MKLETQLRVIAARVRRDERVVMKAKTLRARNEEIARAHKSGWTLRALATKYALTPERIRQIVQKSIRMERFTTRKNRPKPTLWWEL